MCKAIVPVLWTSMGSASKGLLTCVKSGSEELSLRERTVMAGMGLGVGDLGGSKLVMLFAGVLMDLVEQW